MFPICFLDKILSHEALTPIICTFAAAIVACGEAKVSEVDKDGRKKRKKIENILKANFSWKLFFF